MAAIELPPDYFGARPPVFAALVQGFTDQFDGVHTDVATSLDDWQTTTHPDIVASLGAVDGDDPAVSDAVASEQPSIVATPTNSVPAQYGQGDTLAANADNQSSAGGNFHPDIPIVIIGPPPPPPDTQNAPGVDQTQTVPNADQYAAVAPQAQARPELPQASTSPVQPTTEPTPLSVAPEAAQAPLTAIVAADQTTQESGASPVPSPAAPYVTRDELADLLSQLEATIIVMT